MLKLGKWSAVLILCTMLSLSLADTGAFAQSVNSSNTVTAAQTALIAGTMQGVNQAVQDHQPGNCNGGYGDGGNCNGGGGCGGYGGCGPTWNRICIMNRVCHTRRICFWSYERQMCRIQRWCDTIHSCIRRGGWGGYNNGGYAYVRPRH